VIAIDGYVLPSNTTFYLSESANLAGSASSLRDPNRVGVPGAGPAFTNRFGHTPASSQLVGTRSR